MALNTYHKFTPLADFVNRLLLMKHVFSLMQRILLYDLSQFTGKATCPSSELWKSLICKGYLLQTTLVYDVSGSLPLNFWGWNVPQFNRVTWLFTSTRGCLNVVKLFWSLHVTVVHMAIITAIKIVKFQNNETLPFLRDNCVTEIVNRRAEWNVESLHTA